MFDIHGFFELDWARDMDHMKFTSGYVIDTTRNRPSNRGFYESPYKNNPKIHF